MKKYKYEAEPLAFSVWTGKAKHDYLAVLNERGEQGWRFVGFLPNHLKPSGVKHSELIFEKEIAPPPFSISDDID